MQSKKGYLARSHYGNESLIYLSVLIHYIEKKHKSKKDEWDEFWFDYDYYGTDQEIEYTILYKYEVIDSLLHFSNSEGESLIFYPTDEIKDHVDCMLYN